MDYNDEAEHLVIKEQEGKELKEAYQTAKSDHGLDHLITLTCAFAFVDHLILVYRLGDCDKVLTEVEEVCRARGTSDMFYVKCVQALAFLRFKQARFEEAVELFEEQLRETEESAPLLENLGHAYNSIGKESKAEECFQRALDTLNAMGPIEMSKSSKGGILLGLGTCKQNQGKSKEALPFLLEAVEWFQNRHTNETSLEAKASTAVARAYDEIDNPTQSEKYYRSAVRIFTKVVGRDSPLTCNALAKLGMMLYSRNLPGAEEACHEAFILCCDLERDSVRMSTVATLLVQLHNLRSAVPDTLFANAPGCAEAALKVLDTLSAGGTIPLQKDADIAVFYKALGEDLMVCGRHKEAAMYFERAVELLSAVPGPESTQLIQTCLLLLTKGCYPKIKAAAATKPKEEK